MLIALFLAASAAPETLKLEVHGVAKYRCYAGYDGRKVTDERTHAVCDNKESKKLIHEVFSITLTDEPDPEDSHDLFASWTQETDFAGRKFSVTVTVSKADPKEKAKRPYRITLIAADDEPLSRHTTAFTTMAVPTEMDPLSVAMNSAGKKEEISFDVTVEDAAH